MNKNDLDLNQQSDVILPVDNGLEIALLFSIPVKELLWVENESGMTYRVEALNTYRVDHESGVKAEVKTAVYIDADKEVIRMCEMVIGHEDDQFLFKDSIELGTLLQEKDLCDARHQLVQIRIQEN